MHYIQSFLLLRPKIWHSLRSRASCHSGRPQFGGIAHLSETHSLLSRVRDPLPRAISPGNEQSNLLSSRKKNDHVRKNQATHYPPLANAQLAGKVKSADNVLGFKKGREDASIQGRTDTESASPSRRSLGRLNSQVAKSKSSKDPSGNKRGPAILVVEKLQWTVEHLKENKIGDGTNQLRSSLDVQFAKTGAINGIPSAEHSIADLKLLQGAWENLVELLKGAPNIQRGRATPWTGLVEVLVNHPVFHRGEPPVIVPRISDAHRLAEAAGRLCMSELVPRIEALIAAAVANCNSCISSRAPIALDIALILEMYTRTDRDLAERFYRKLMSQRKVPLPGYYAMARMYETSGEPQKVMKIIKDSVKMGYCKDRGSDSALVACFLRATGAAQGIDAEVQEVYSLRAKKAFGLTLEYLERLLARLRTRRRATLADSIAKIAVDVKVEEEDRERLRVAGYDSPFYYRDEESPPEPPSAEKVASAMGAKILNGLHEDAIALVNELPEEQRFSVAAVNAHHLNALIELQRDDAIGALHSKAVANRRQGKDSVNSPYFASLFRYLVRDCGSFEMGMRMFHEAKDMRLRLFPESLNILYWHAFRERHFKEMNLLVEYMKLHYPNALRTQLATRVEPAFMEGDYSIGRKELAHVMRTYSTELRTYHFAQYVDYLARKRDAYELDELDAMVQGRGGGKSGQRQGIVPSLRPCELYLTSLMKAYSYCERECAVYHVWDQLLTAGVKPPIATQCIVIDTAGHFINPLKVRELQEFFIKYYAGRQDNNINVWTSLLEAHLRCGNLAEAKHIAFTLVPEMELKYNSKFIYTLWSTNWRNLGTRDDPAIRGFVWDHRHLSTSRIPDFI